MTKKLIVLQDEKSLLIVAAEGGHELALPLLLDNGVDIDFKQEVIVQQYPL